MEVFEVLEVGVNVLEEVELEDLEENLEAKGDVGVGPGDGLEVVKSERNHKGLVARPLVARSPRSARVVYR